MDASGLVSRTERRWPVSLLLLLLPALVSCWGKQLDPVTHEPPSQAPGCRPPIELTEMPVRINEIMVKNVSALRDEHGRFSPWVELYNPTDEPFDMGNVPLSNELLEAGKWSIPCIPEAVIPPKGFLVIFLDDDDEPDDLHANFTLTAGPEMELTLNKGSHNTFFDASDLDPDVSLSRFPDGTGRLAASAPTPGKPNGPPLPPKELAFVRGDANGTGRINVSDMALILKVVSGEEPLPPCADRLDSNDDGAVSELDGFYIQQMLFAGGPAPPPPFPAAGADPTADELHCFE